MVTADLAFKNMSDEQMMEINGGAVISAILAVAGACITIYGIYETGKNHIYDNSYEKAYKAEYERLEEIYYKNNAGSGSGGVRYMQAQ